MATNLYGFVPKLSHHGGKNPALRALVLMAWLFACEQAPAQATPSSLVALQLKTSSEEKTIKTAQRCANLKVVFQRDARVISTMMAEFWYKTVVDCCHVRELALRNNGNEPIR